MREIIIFGNGETALLAYEYFTHDSEYTVVSFVVDEQFITATDINGIPVTAVHDAASKYPPSKYKAFVAVSSTKLNRVRKDTYYRAKELGYKLVSYVSSRAFVWGNVMIGENCFILENNTIQPFVSISHNVTLWSGNHIGHRSEIEAHCFISSHCVISGFCRIEEGCFLGVNATLEDNTTIAKDNFIGAGALIQKDTGPLSLFQVKQTDLSKVNTHRLFRIKE